jgi:hypothetical protein
VTPSADQVERSDADDQTDRIAHDAAFDLLSSRRRRFVLNRLQRQPEGVEIGDLATQLASYENDAPPGELSRKERKRIYVSLYQTHVPKLEEAGVITYDSDTGLVEPTDRIGELAAYFSTTDGSDPEAVVIGLVAVGGLGLYTMALSAAVRSVEPLQVAVGVLLGILLLGLGHYVHLAMGHRDGSTIPIGSEE